MRWVTIVGDDSILPASPGTRETTPAPSAPPLNEAKSAVQERVEQLLATAEAHQDQCDRREFRIDFINTAGGASVVMMIGFNVWLVATTSRWSWAALGISFVLGWALIFGTTLRASRIKLRRNQRTLGEIVKLLRETEEIMSIQEMWSPFERAQIRIRLSRFDSGLERGGSMGTRGQ